MKDDAETPTTRQPCAGARKAAQVLGIPGKCPDTSRKVCEVSERRFGSSEQNIRSSERTFGCPESRADGKHTARKCPERHATRRKFAQLLENCADWADTLRRVSESEFASRQVAQGAGTLRNVPAREIGSSER